MSCNAILGLCDKHQVHEGGSHSISAMQVSYKLNPQVWQAFQHSRMTDAEPVPTKAPKAHWHSVLVIFTLQHIQ